MSKYRLLTLAVAVVAIAVIIASFLLPSSPPNSISSPDGDRFSSSSRRSLSPLYPTVIPTPTHLAPTITPENIFISQSLRISFQLPPTYHLLQEVADKYNRIVMFLTDDERGFTITRSSSSGQSLSSFRYLGKVAQSRGQLAGHEAMIYKSRAEGDDIEGTPAYVAYIIAIENDFIQLVFHGDQSIDVEEQLVLATFKLL